MRERWIAQFAETEAQAAPDPNRRDDRKRDGCGIGNILGHPQHLKHASNCQYQERLDPSRGSALSFRLRVIPV